MVDGNIIILPRSRLAEFLTFIYKGKGKKEKVPWNNVRVLSGSLPEDAPPPIPVLKEKKEVLRCGGIRKRKREYDLHLGLYNHNQHQSQPWLVIYPYALILL